MSDTYHQRPGWAREFDLEQSRAFEDDVMRALAEDFSTVERHTDATDLLDFLADGIWIEVKEKHTAYSPLWIEGLPIGSTDDIFILDELTIMKAVHEKGPVWFLLRDTVAGKIYVAGLWDVLAVGPIARKNRKAKGKWLLPLTSFTEVESLELAVKVIRVRSEQSPWLDPSCYHGRKMTRDTKL